MPLVKVRTPVRPSEDPEKVRRAVLNVFPGADVQIRGGALEARTESLAELRSLVRRQKILDAARKTFLRGLEPGGTRARFFLNKQAACRGRVSFSAELGAPLGDLEVEVEDPRLETLLKEMAPMTIRGIPVSEEQAVREIARRRATKGVGREKPPLDEDWDASIEADEEADGGEAEDL